VNCFSIIKDLDFPCYYLWFHVRGVSYSAYVTLKLDLNWYDDPFTHYRSYTPDRAVILLQFEDDK
jgi:hypothetical protein